MYGYENRGIGKNLAVMFTNKRAIGPIFIPSTLSLRRSPLCTSPKGSRSRKALGIEVLQFVTWLLQTLTHNTPISAQEVPLLSLRSKQSESAPEIDTIASGHELRLGRKCALAVLARLSFAYRENGVNVRLPEDFILASEEVFAYCTISKM